MCLQGSANEQWRPGTPFRYGDFLGRYMTSYWIRTEDVQLRCVTFIYGMPFENVFILNAGVQFNWRKTQFLFGRRWEVAFPLRRRQF